MNSHHLHHDMYYDPLSSRSPGAHRHQQQTLHRQPSRQFDAYGPMPNNIYTQEDQNLRYDNNRFDRMNPGMQNGGYTYEPLGAQSWSPTAFGGGNNQFAGFGAPGRMKPPARGRSGLPSVRRTLCCTSWAIQDPLMTNNIALRLGSISSSFPHQILFQGSADPISEVPSFARSSIPQIQTMSLYPQLSLSRIFPLR